MHLNNYNYIYSSASKIKKVYFGYGGTRGPLSLVSHMVASIMSSSFYENYVFT